MSQWRIEQQGTHEWAVRRNNEVHFAQTAKDAVELLHALRNEQE